MWDRRLLKKKKLLKRVECEAAQGRQGDRFHKLKSEIVDLLRLDKKMWQQRSKEHWMISGDHNSKYFHTRALQRFHQNRIIELRNPEGVLISGEGDLSVMVRDYYKNLFLSSRPTKVDELILSIKLAVIDDMNKCLISPFSRVEIECALIRWPLLKPPAPTESLPFSSKNFGVILATMWSEQCCFALILVVWFQVWTILLFPLFLKLKILTMLLNSDPLCSVISYISWYQKCWLIGWKKFYLISFQNPRVPFNLIRQFQTIFWWPSKLFTIWSERKGGKVGHLALKSDISKAYDRLKWVFLKKVMGRMGFHGRWVGWIMECV